MYISDVALALGARPSYTGQHQYVLHCSEAVPYCNKWNAPYKFDIWRPLLPSLYENLEVMAFVRLVSLLKKYSLIIPQESWKELVFRQAKLWMYSTAPYIDCSI